MIGILLINLGTPNAPTEEAVRVYLNEFLSDPYVITLPKLLRDFLVQKIILPKRPKLSAHAYQKIWTDQGSPLLVNSVALKNKLVIGYRLPVTNHAHQPHIALGMRYGNPSIASAIEELKNKNCEKLIVLPLFPQFARATTQSALDQVDLILKQKNYYPKIKIIHDFHDQDFYIHSLANLIQKNISPDHFLLLSYHGLPARHRDSKNYRAQCYKTSDLIAQQLKLNEDQYQVAFQSRLGFTKWITPYTDHIIKELRQKNIKNLSVACPSFVADCIETLEEINIRLRAQWMQLGGESFELIPCLNADDEWIDTLCRWLKNYSLCFTQSSNASSSN